MIVYDPADGAVAFDHPTTVVIAGKPRQGIRYIDARVVEAWRHADSVEASKPKRQSEEVAADG